MLDNCLVNVEASISHSGLREDSSLLCIIPSRLINSYQNFRMAEAVHLSVVNTDAEDEGRKLFRSPGNNLIIALSLYR